VKAEPVKVEPVKVEPVKVEPTKTEPVKAEPTKSEPVKAEPTKTRPTKSTESKKPGVVNVVTLAGGEPVPAFVDVDGIRKGSTPIKLTLEPGKHELVFRQQGYATVTKSLTVTAGETTKLKVELTP
jgi:hypothetical protein